MGWVEKNVVVPLGNLLLEQQNLQKIQAVFEPMLDRMVNNAITQVGLQVSATEIKVIDKIEQQAKASEQTVVSSVSNVEQCILASIKGVLDTVTGLPGSVVNAIKGLNPFHL